MIIHVLHIQLMLISPVDISGQNPQRLMGGAWEMTTYLVSP